ncbi:class A beta-lactamase [Blastochloris viridis]|uniref:Beta-lactamase n=1 Tax=Blastochloris viridis TaxID=1079 RepID=A0A0H5BBF8_BLAVI|nr:class A beta-lactamase [Blastochloris viridis]ALK08297.1 Beta-lactamase OXY-1 precursor [Blastochloris viridis]BAR98434.1 beta-lactamase [Blastochloris viridis]CUU44219.1 Beta-lactamase OXY-1 precursor [Blastochloris viridis]
MISRRNLLAGALLAAPAGAADDWAAATERALADLERRFGGRLGVAILDTGSARRASHRGSERFALCSTFKVLAAAVVLARVERGDDSLDRRILYRRDDLVPYSPVTERRLADGMTLGELCEATMTLSDNTAANLLLDSFGGPAAVTAMLRGLGDGATRLDRREPALNDVPPGEERDTTTPQAMGDTLLRLVVGNALAPASRHRLIEWLVNCKTGDQRLRAGVPAAWRVGDKTGSGPRGEANDVAVMWPPGRAPMVVTAYYVNPAGSADARNAVLAEVGRLVAAA